jgi:hypothetical protein
MPDARTPSVSHNRPERIGPPRVCAELAAPTPVGQAVTVEATTYPPTPPQTTMTPTVCHASVRLLRPFDPASAPHLSEPAQDRHGDCGRHEVSQVPIRSLTPRTGLRLRWSGGLSQNGPAHAACGGSQRLGLHGKNLSKLNTVLVVSLCTLRDRRHQRHRNTRYRAGATP